jgi:hypothetical protein
VAGPWDIVYVEEGDGSAPGLEYIQNLPIKVRARVDAVLEAVAAAPPPSFSGGGFWEAMHSPMTDYHEVRVRGDVPGGAKMNFRIFCYLDRAGPGLPRPAIAILGGMTKAPRTGFTPADYAEIRGVADRYRATSPRRIVAR